MAQEYKNSITVEVDRCLSPEEGPDLYQFEISFSQKAIDRIIEASEFIAKTGESGDSVSLLLSGDAKIIAFSGSCNCEDLYEYEGEEYSKIVFTRFGVLADSFYAQVDVENSGSYYSESIKIDEIKAARAQGSQNG
jgi:hypothetical protein